ncbi:MAG: hypothetical protein EXS59_00230 [Candidatus Taylorbacteria bacterium]|nr:hypothetical protein [Candidatus Taylorbacteria bacterium]
MSDNFEKNRIDFGKSSDRDDRNVLEVSAGTPERVALFSGDDGEVPIKHGEVGGDFSDAHRIDLVRKELVKNTLNEPPKGFVPLYPAPDKVFQPKVRPAGRFKRWFTIAMAGIGLLGASKAEAADLSKPADKTGGVPVFNAPTVKSADTNIFRYAQPTFKLTPEQLEANKKALKEAYEARTAGQRGGNGSVTITAHPGFDNSANANQGVSPNVNPNQMNSGNYPVERGNGMNYGNLPAQRQSLMNQGGRIVPARDQNSGRQDITYMGGDEVFVPHGVSLPTEKRKLFGVKYQAVTRHSVGIEAQVGGQPNRIPPQPRNPRSR